MSGTEEGCLGFVTFISETNRSRCLKSRDTFPLFRRELRVSAGSLPASALRLHIALLSVHTIGPVVAVSLHTLSPHFSLPPSHPAKKLREQAGQQSQIIE